MVCVVAAATRAPAPMLPATRSRTSLPEPISPPLRIPSLPAPWPYGPEPDSGLNVLPAYTKGASPARDDAPCMPRRTAGRWERGELPGREDAACQLFASAFEASAVVKLTGWLL